jgi:hypothetical protein
MSIHSINWGYINLTMARKALWSPKARKIQIVCCEFITMKKSTIICGSAVVLVFILSAYLLLPKSEKIDDWQYEPEYRIRPLFIGPQSAAMEAGDIGLAAGGAKALNCSVLHTAMPSLKILFPKKVEYYVAVGLNSGIKERDFERKKLNLVIVLDISGSMDSLYHLVRQRKS